MLMGKMRNFVQSVDVCWERKLKEVGLSNMRRELQGSHAVTS